MPTRSSQLSTTDALLQTRRQLLKGTALLIAITSLVNVLILLIGENPSYPIAAGLAGMTLLCFGIFALAQYGYVTIGGVAFSLAMMLFTTVISPTEVVQGSSGVSYLIAALTAGMTAGANAALLSGLLGMSIIVLLGTVGNIAWVDNTNANFFIILIVTVLMWLVIRSLERALQDARTQTVAALAAQETIIAREQALVQTNQNLLMSNQQMEALFATVRDLETPVIPLLAGVMLVPLVGQLDSVRVERITVAVLEAVYTQRTQTVIVDITGIAGIDQALAANLVQLAQAVQLLGARVLITGISAAVAQMMVATGIDLGTIQTTGRLQDGLALVITANA